MDISCSCKINISSSHHIPVGLQHISLLCFLHSLCTAWLSHSTWLLIWPIDCYFIGEFPEAEWVCSALTPEARKDFQYISTASGSRMPQAISWWGLEHILEKYLPVPALFLLSFSPLFYRSLSRDRLPNYRNIWFDYNSNKISLTFYYYANNLI